MAVSTEHIKDILIGDGVNTKFPFTFQVLSKEQIQCLKVLATGEEIEVLKTEVAISLNDGGSNGGEVTYPLIGEPLPEGCKFIIFRQTEIKQDYTPPNGQVFDAVAIKNEIDRLTMQNQEQEESLSRSVQLSMGSGAKPEEYLENVNEMLANARKLEEEAVQATVKNIEDAKAQVQIATQKAELAAQSESAAAASAKSAAAAVDGFDAHAADKQSVFDENVAIQTNGFNSNAVQKQQSVDASAELARKYAQGTTEEMPSGSAKYWAAEAERIYNRTDVQPMSIYQDRIIMDGTVITVYDRKCRYFRNTEAGDAYTIDLSHAKKTFCDITIDLILNMTEPVPVDFSAVLPTGKWLNDNVPDFSAAGEYWIALVSDDYGQSWRASYEGVYAL